MKSKKVQQMYATLYLVDVASAFKSISNVVWFAGASSFC